MNCGTFLLGMGAGVVVGAGVAMMNPKQSKRMKHQVDDSFHKFGAAMEDAMETMLGELR